jgi:hypothetical protein
MVADMTDFEAQVRRKALMLQYGVESSTEDMDQLLVTCAAEIYNNFGTEVIRWDPSTVRPVGVVSGEVEI